jgi:hypothetical protein
MVLVAELTLRLYKIATENVKPFSISDQIMTFSK